MAEYPHYGSAVPHVTAEKESVSLREAYPEHEVQGVYMSKQAKWEGAGEAERRRTVLRRGMSVLLFCVAGVAVLFMSSAIAGGERGLNHRAYSDDPEAGLFSSTDDDCDKYENTDKYSAESCALWDEYQCDMACFKGTTCAYLCGEACSKGEGAICALQTMNSSSAFVAACARADTYSPTSNFSFPGWASERPPDDWNGNVTHNDDRYYVLETTSPFANSTGCDHHLECSFWTDYYKFLHDEARQLQDTGDVPNFLGSHMALLNDPWLKKMCNYAASTIFVGDDASAR